MACIMKQHMVERCFLYITPYLSEVDRVCEVREAVFPVYLAVRSSGVYGVPSSFVNNKAGEIIQPVLYEAVTASSEQFISLEVSGCWKEPIRYPEAL